MSCFVVSNVHCESWSVDSTGNVIPPSARAPYRADDAELEGTACGSCASDHDAKTRHPDSGLRLQQARHRGRGVVAPIAAPVMMMYPRESRRQANPIRLSVAHDLGHDIDGAWWPRADRITNELPNLVAVLTPLLGEITSINVNWQPLQRPPDFNWPGWEHKRQHVMTLSGTDGSANLLIIAYSTHSALSLMVMRCAANLPIDAADRDKNAFATAGSILRVAQQQLVSGVY